MSGLYVYALAGSPSAAFRRAGHAVRFENLDGVYAAVERRTASPALSEPELLVQHEIVAEIARRADAVLPARFGSFMPQDELGRVVNLRRDAIREALDLVRGRAQMTIRILGDARPPETGHRPGRSGSGQRSGTAYLVDRQAAARSKLPPDITAALNEAVQDLVVAVRAEPGEGSTLARLYHLIERGTDGAYRQALAPAIDALSAATIVATGPWPAFAFAPELWP
jgi:hypothetical protein